MLINAKYCTEIKGYYCPHTLTDSELAVLMQKRDVVTTDSFLETSAQQQPKNNKQIILELLGKGIKAEIQNTMSETHDLSAC